MTSSDIVTVAQGVNPLSPEMIKTSGDIIYRQTKFMVIVAASIVGFITLIVIGYLIYRWIKNSGSTSSVFEASQNIVTSELTYKPVDYTSMADVLFQAMNGVGFTNTDSVKKIFQMLKTPSDWYQLVKTFDVKGSTAFYSKWKGNLIEWIADEYSNSSSDLAELSQILTSIGVQSPF